MSLRKWHGCLSLLSSILLLVLALLGRISLFFIILAALNIASAMAYLLLTMNAKDGKWLEGTDGKIGAPNWFSIARISFAPIIPFVFITQPFGSSSYSIGTITMCVIILTDCIDGLLARRPNSKTGRPDHKTEAGRMLDPLADKVIFYLCLIGLGYASNGTFVVPGFQINPWMQGYAYFFIASTLAHDISFIVVYILYIHRQKDKKAFESKLLDKIHFGSSCAWVILVGWTLTFLTPHLSWITFACLAVTGILSLMTIRTGYARLKMHMIATNSTFLISKTPR